MNKYMRDWEKEILDRGNWIKSYVEKAGAKGVGLGLSGGKDSVIVSYICRRVGIHVLGVSMPCGNIPSDERVARKYAEMMNIEFSVINLYEPFSSMVKLMKECTGIEPTGLSLANIKPRLRMTTIYALCQERGYLVVGTGNRSEEVMGYFTKWGDGAADLNPISDLTVRELYDLMRYINDTDSTMDFNEILERVPSAGLYEGQTDEDEMGISYEKIDQYILGLTDKESEEFISNVYNKTMHKRKPIPVYKEVEKRDVPIGKMYTSNR